MRGSARLPRVSLYDMFVKFYRARVKAGDGDPDHADMAVVRFSTTLEQSGRRLWKVYLEGHPDDETVEVVVQRHNFDHVRRMAWAELVASSKNISSTDDLRSILDKLGMGAVLGKKRAAAAGSTMSSRHGVVHGAADAGIDVVDAFGEIEPLIRDMLSNDLEALIQMDLAKAHVAETVPGSTWSPRECHEAIVERCSKARGGDQALVQRSMGRSLAALERDAEALEAYTRAAEINPEYAAAHAGRGDALYALDRDAEALEAYTRAAEINPEYAAAHAGRGDALYALDRDAEALEAYTRAAEINPEYAAAHAGRG